VASEAEYLSISLTSREAATQVGQRLDAALPDGIDVIDVTEDAPAGTGGPAAKADKTFARLEASEWRIVLPGVEPAAAGLAVASFLALGEAPVERLTDKGVRRLDARAAVVELDLLRPDEITADPDGGQSAAVTGHNDCAILRMVVLHTVPAVRPEDVLTALREREGIVPSLPPVTTRLMQGSRAMLTGKTLCAGDGS
jgi:hypothetical protein